MSRETGEERERRRYVETVAEEADDRSRAAGFDVVRLGGGPSPSPDVCAQSNGCYFDPYDGQDGVRCSRCGAPKKLAETLYRVPA